MLPDDAVRRALANPAAVGSYLQQHLPVYREYNQVGARGPLFWLSKQYHRRVAPPAEPVSIWDREWDLLILLDACRVDMMAAVTSAYPFLEPVDSIWSVGGDSREWLQETFGDAPPERLERTGYVTANYFSREVADRPFAVFENLQSVVTEDLPVVPAHVVTDHAVDIARRSDCDRLIVHYMQPHKPFLTRGADRRSVSVADWSTGWGLYQAALSGPKEPADVYEGFVDNLRYVLDEVSLLLDNVDAPRTVITSDHGNAIGEAFLWDHEPGVNHPAMRWVPWVETTATDTGSLTPETYSRRELDDADVRDRLEQLGYR